MRFYRLLSVIGVHGSRNYDADAILSRSPENGCDLVSREQPPIRLSIYF